MTPWHTEAEGVCRHVKLPQSRLTLCNPMDRSPPGSSVHGLLQARILEWVAIPSPGELSDPGIKLGSLALQADCLPAEPPEKPNNCSQREKSMVPVIKMLVTRPKSKG